MDKKPKKSYIDQYKERFPGDDPSKGRIIIDDDGHSHFIPSGKLPYRHYSLYGNRPLRPATPAPFPEKMPKMGKDGRYEPMTYAELMAVRNYVSDLRDRGLGDIWEETNGGMGHVSKVDQFKKLNPILNVDLYKIPVIMEDGTIGKQPDFFKY